MLAANIPLGLPSAARAPPPSTETASGSRELTTTNVTTPRIMNTTV